MPEQQTDRLKQIRERLDAAAAKDRPDCGPFTATPEGGTDPYDHELARIWGPDGDQLGTSYGNLALGIDGDALAEMWAHAPQDVAWLLGEGERLRAALDDISDGCHCRRPDPWAIGRCDCQTDTARAALEPRND